MRITIEFRPDIGTFCALLEGLVRVNVWLLSTHSKLPPLYQSGVVYRREGFRREDWLTAPEVFKLTYGDCEDLSAWRAAELRNAGERGARAIAVRGGPHLWHAVVQRANGDIEDPSKKLGMGSQHDSARSPKPSKAKTPRARPIKKG